MVLEFLLVGKKLQVAEAGAETLFVTSSGSERRVVGFGRRIFFFDETQGIERIPNKRFERIYDGKERCPHYADDTIRYAHLFLMFLDRRPISVAHMEFFTLRFDGLGFHDREFLNRLAMMTYQPVQSQVCGGNNVVYVSNRIAQRALARLHWAPTDREMEALRNQLPPGLI